MIRRHLTGQSRGFTIVELLIAMGVFAMVLLIITTAFIQISKVYYKGVTETATQNVARAAMDSITQAIQFNGGTITDTTTGPIANTTYAICIGNIRFSYRVGAQMVEASPGTSQTLHALVQDTPAACSSATPQSINVNPLSTTTGSRELLNTKMRLANFSVKNIGNNLYEVKVRVVYGDDDLLTNPTTANAKCKGVSAGSQFCSSSELSTVVQKRVR